MSNIEHSEIEPMLWLVHDECMEWLTVRRESQVSTNKRIDQLTLAIADLAKALAGGYRKGGYKDE